MTQQGNNDRLKKPFVPSFILDNASDPHGKSCYFRPLLLLYVEFNIIASFFFFAKITLICISSCIFCLTLINLEAMLLYCIHKTFCSRGTIYTISLSVVFCFNFLLILDQSGTILLLH